jgi:hypothetical protein
MNHLYAIIALSTLSVLLIQSSQASDVFASTLLRYENETNQVNLSLRKRIRLIASVGITSELNNRWSFTAEARTGLKNKHNVPAITVYQITDQPEGVK